MTAHILDYQGVECYRRRGARVQLDSGTGPLTINDVARLAGVSRQTVSRVLNGSGAVRDVTRHRVQEIIHQLGYEPNTFARGLSLGRTNTIGLVLPDITNPFYPEVASSVELLARTHGYRVLFCNTRHDPEEEVRNLNLLRQQQVDGLIVCGSRLPAKRLNGLLGRLGPCVLVNSPVSEAPSNVAVVRIDFAEASRQSVLHLLRLGHRRIGFVNSTRASAGGTRKACGYKEALSETGIRLDPNLITAADPSVDGGSKGMHRMIRAGCTAVCFYSDIMALGAILACEESDMRVPRDVAVVGFGDHPFAPAVRPSLTSVRVPLADIGARAIELLLRLLARDADVPLEEVLHTELIVRDSSGKGIG